MNLEVYMNPNMMRNLLENVVAGIISIDTKGTIRFFNPAASKLFGYSEEEVMGENVKMLMPEPYHSEHDLYLARYKATKITKVIGTTGREVVCQRKNGTHFAADLSLSEMVVSYETFYVGVITDVTKRKIAEMNLRRSEAINKAVVDTAVTAIIRIDSKGIIQAFNQAAEKLFYYRANEIIGKNVSVLMDEPHLSKHDSYLFNHLETGESRVIGIGREVVCLRKDKTTFPADLAVSKIVLGKETLFIGILTDITQRKLLEESRRSYREKLEEIIDSRIADK
jgi:two-component system, LuxR family, sensor kinase FixL